MATASFQAIISVTFVFLFGACSGAQTSSGAGLSFHTIDKGFTSGVRERQALILKSESEWKQIWQDHVGPSRPAKDLPRVAFDKEMVVAVFLGERSSGGYGIEIKTIEEDRNTRQLRVVAQETKPAAGAMVIQALTQPYHIVRVRKSDLPVSFITKP